VKNKAATDGGERRAHRGVRRPLFAQDNDEVFVTGSTYAGEEVNSRRRRRRHRVVVEDRSVAPV